MTIPDFEIDETARLVVWNVARAMPEQRLSTPWAILWRGEEQRAGLVIEVKARAAFDLLMHYGPTSYFETVAPGRHRFLLTLLDSTDVA